MSVTDDDILNFFTEHPEWTPTFNRDANISALAPDDVEPSGSTPEGTPEPSPSEPEAPQSETPPTEEPPEVEPEGSSGGVEDNASTPPSPGDAAPLPPDDLPTELVFGDQRVSRSEFEALVALRDQITSDPNFARVLSGYLTGQGPAAEGGPVASGQPPETTTVPTPELPTLDLEDPTINTLWQTIQAQKQQLELLNRNVASVAEQQQARAMAEARAMYQSAAESFKAEKGLDDEDVANLTQIAGRLGVVQSLVSGTDPLTGLPVPVDQISAARRALEIAYYVTPEYRERDFRQSVEQRRKDESRRQLLGSVGGSPGSVARTRPAPTPGSPEARNEMIREVAEVLSGNTLPE